jgi:hypothetical protein
MTRTLADAIDPLFRYCDGLDVFPNDEAMEKFIEESRADLENPDHHLYADM